MVKINSAGLCPTQYYIYDDSYNGQYLHSDMKWYDSTESEWGSKIYSGYYDSEAEAEATLAKWQGNFLGSGEKYTPSLDDVYKGLGIYRETIFNDNKEVVVITENGRLSISDLFHLICQRWDWGSEEDREKIKDEMAIMNWYHQTVLPILKGEQKL
jgi:hypothetical protein